MNLDINSIIQLISLGISAGTNIYLSFKHNADGTVDITVTQTHTLSDLSADLSQAAQWFASHGVIVPTATPAAPPPAGGSII